MKKVKIVIEICERDRSILSLWSERLQEKINKFDKDGYDLFSSCMVGTCHIFLYFKRKPIWRRLWT